MDLRIPLTDLAIGDPEVAAVEAVLRGRWLTSGARTAEFQRRFAECHGATCAYAVSNCTAALHLAAVGIGLGPGDEVICPDLTFVATANAIRYTGATPVFAAPVSEYDLTMCPRHAESLIGPRTRAICVMHYAGYACDMDAFLDLARRYDLQLIEDCAHAPMASTRLADGTRPMLGTLGRAGCFSFFGTKNISTGEGGMVLVSDPALGAEIDRLRTHGITVPTFVRHNKPVLGYDVEGLGFNYRFDDIRAALGLCQLDRLPGLNRVRRHLVQEYRAALADVPGVIVPFADRDVALSACHLMPVVIDADVARVRARMRQDGIQTSKHYEPVSSFALYRSEIESPAAEIAARLLTLPLGPHMDADSVHEVVESLEHALGLARLRGAA